MGLSRRRGVDGAGGFVDHTKAVGWPSLRWWLQGERQPRNRARFPLPPPVQPPFLHVRLAARPPVTILRILCALCLLLQPACRAPGLRVCDIPMARDATFDLLPPSALGRSISLEQIVVAKHGEREFTFHCLLEVDPQRLVLVGMTPFHTRAFTIELSDEELSIDVSPGAQLPAEPSRILADLQLALWPEPKIDGLEARLIQTQSGGLGRTWSRGESAVVQVTYSLEMKDRRAPWVGTLRFEQLEQQYTLEVTTVRAETLAP